MGVNTYWLVVGIIIFLGMIMPQQGRNSKYYIIVITAIQIFVCGCRYMYLTGDLIKYEATFQELSHYGWMSNYVWHEGRNAGFQWLMKFISEISNGNFQLFLVILAFITQIALAIMIYKYSPKPWLSFLVWNCMAFYVTYDFTSIKQGLAMSILMFSLINIIEDRPKRFLLFTLLAGFIHLPALCFLPAYWIAKRRINTKTILVYLIAAIIIFIFRNSIIDSITELYYAGNDEIEFIASSNGIGGRVVVIVLILAIGLVLNGIRENVIESLFNLIIIAAIFQMFASFNNVFTRLADYYLQFSVLFIPMIFYGSKGKTLERERYIIKPLLFNSRSIKILVLLLTIILIWWYQRTCLGVTFANDVDNYTKYLFMWQVQ